MLVFLLYFHLHLRSFVIMNHTPKIILYRESETGMGIVEKYVVKKRVEYNVHDLQSLW